MDNYYRLLNISSTASDDEIEEALHTEERIWMNRQGLPQLERRQEAEKIVARLDKAREILLDKKARSAYDRSLKNSPQDERQVGDEELTGDLIRQGWDYLMDGSVADALYVATKATENDGKNPEAWGLLAQIKARNNEYEDAIYEFKRAIKLAPDKAVYYFDLGSVYQSVERFSEALDRYENAVQIEPNEHQYKVALAFGYLNMMTENWTSVQNKTDYVYATQKEHLLKAHEWIKKAEALNIDDPGVSEYMIERKGVLKKAAKTRFCGKYWTGLISIILGLSLLRVEGIGFIYLFFGILYFIAYRLPQYEINRQAIAGEGTLTIFDRIDNFFEGVARNTTVYGNGYLDLQMKKAQGNFILAIIKLILNLFILPFVVIIKLIINFKNGLYSNILKHK